VEVGSPQGVIKATAIARVVKRWGVAAADVIYVGDAVADMEAAREAGVLPIAAAWAPSAIAHELAATKPHALFTDASHFQSWLTEVLAP
jgi:phosphoglycolate phosphatase-like HAD superfamily hydrolase